LRADPVHGPALTQPVPARSGVVPERLGPERAPGVAPNRLAPVARGPEYHIPPREGPIDRPRPAGVRDVRFANGGAVRFRPDGRPSDFHDPRRNLDIHNHIGPGRRIEFERKDHVRLVVDHGRRGYMERGFAYRGHDLVRRTYAYHGRVYDRFYSPYSFHGARLAVYMPVRFYAPGFYGYAYHPFVAPVHYTWGFTAAPWYGPSAAYFTPAPVYPTPSLWLADFAVAQTLAAGYQAALEAGGAPPPPVDGDPMGDEVRQDVADEVQGEISLENTEAAQNFQGAEIDPGSSSIARLFADGQPHVFLAAEEIDVIDAQGQECALTEGDVVQTGAPPAADDPEARVAVLASKGGRDCQRGAVVSVPVEQLQEMRNHMRELVDQGLAELQSSQAKGLIPPAPPAANAATPPSPATFAVLVPPPDPNVAADLDKEEAEADKSSKDLMKDAASKSGAM